MNIATAVDRGLAIRAQIEALKIELEIIESTLELAARTGRQVPLEDPDREGRQFMARGTKSIVPVVLTADLIQASFAQGSAFHKKIDAVSCGKLKEFYHPVTTWKMLAKSGKAFRAQAAQILGDAAPGLITAAVARDKHGIPKSHIKVEWDRSAPQS